MIPVDAFRHVPVLEGTAITLEPLTEAVFEPYWAAMHDPEVTRLTGTHATFEPAVIESWLRTRRDHHDRADWAIMRSSDRTFVGEAVINDLDLENESASYRIWLTAPSEFGRGYGTEATRLIIDFVLDTVGLHRLSLEVFDHNPRARHVYEKCGFVVEGRLREALVWDGQRHDTLTMAILRTDHRPAHSPTHEPDLIGDGDPPGDRHSIPG